MKFKMPKRSSKTTFVGMPKKYSRTQKGKKTPLRKKYNAVKKKQFVKKMKRVVRASKSRAISAMSVAAQPQTQLVKFTMSFAKTYRMANTFNASAMGTNHDQNDLFPDAGMEIHQNTLYDPLNLANSIGVTNYHANGFEEMSRKYRRYRVVGSKTIIKFRRMGGLIPLFNGGTDKNTNLTTGQNDTYPSASNASNLGHIFDPSTADPLLCMTVDRSAFQDSYATIPDTAIDEFMDLAKWKHLKGIKWRELKAGPGEKVILVEKFSEKGLVSAAGDADYKTNNTGTFHDVDATGGQITTGSNPPVLDKLTLKIKPYDKLSLQRQRYHCARIMVTIEQEFLALCSEPRYAYAQSTA